MIWRCIVTARLMPMSSDPTSLERCPATATRVESAVAPPGGPLVWRELLTAEPGVVERGSARRTDQPARPGPLALRGNAATDHGNERIKSNRSGLASIAASRIVDLPGNINQAIGSLRIFDQVAVLVALTQVARRDLYRDVSGMPIFVTSNLRELNPEVTHLLFGLHFVCTLMCAGAR